MKNRSPTQSYTPSSLKVEPREKDQVSSDIKWSDDLESGPATRKNSFIALIGACWCLILHYTLSVGVAMLILFCVEGHHFNVTERTPLVQVVGGTQLTRFLLKQSDVVTFLSSTIAVLKFTLSAWGASLCWNIALFLMERQGLTRQDLKALLKYGLLAPGAYSRDWSIIVIGVLLAATLVGHLSSPILTGSISWIPSNRLVHDLSNNTVEFKALEDHHLANLPESYYNYSTTRQTFVMGGLGGIANAWGTDTEKGVLKRVSNTMNALNVNSTVDNIILPYFQVHSIRWIENKDEIPRIRDGESPDDVLDPYFTTTPVPISNFPVGYAILVPNVTTNSTNWSTDPLDSTIIHDTRLLILNYGYDEPTRMWTLTNDLPSDTYILPRSPAYLAFAWVTFSAGVGRCRAHNCVVESPSIIRNNTALEIEPHQLTFQALSMAPVLGVHLASANMSLPIAWDNINDYVEAVLMRSYSGAWMIMNANFLRLPTISNYIPSLSSLLAQTDHRRIYLWLAIQLIVTIMSVLFLIAQYRLSAYPLIGDTSLIAFDLDTTALPVDDASRSIHRVRRIELQGDKLVAKN